ncbi:E3 ubiquitin-protein ligase rnf168 [Rhinoraja longicauda]
MKQSKRSGPAKAEASSPPPALSLAECTCPVCQEMLAEPVTPPCGHSLCRGCFQQTVTISNMNCPLCRRRLSNWVRAQVRRGGLVNTELEQRIRQQFLRNGVVGPTEVDRLCPPPQLCKPGELRQEYEEQISKLQAERRAFEEEEHRASEDFIQKLLAEEREQQMHAEQNRKEMDEQLKKDEKLAKILTEEVNSIHRATPEKLGGHTKSISSKFNSSISKGTKLIAPSPNNMEDIQRYLSPTLPKHQTAAINRLRNNVSGPEITSEADEIISSSSSTTNIHLFNCDKEEETVSSSDHSELVQFIEGTPDEAIADCQMGEYTSQCSSEHNESEMLEACSSAHNVGKSKEDVALIELKMNSSNCNENLVDFTTVPILNNKLETDFSSAGSTSTNVAHATVQHLIQDETTEHEILSQSPFKMTTVAKRKACNSTEVSTSTGVLVKKRKICPEIHDEPSENPQFCHNMFNHDHPADWESQLLDKCKMEETDRLLAIKLQKELDKETQTVNRTRGTPDEYLLRTKNLPKNCEQKVLAKNKTPLATPKSHRNSKTPSRSQSSISNKQTMLKNNSSMTCRQKRGIFQDPTRLFNNQKAQCQRTLASMDANSAALITVSELRNSRKQQTIVDMFQKCNTK